MRLNIGDKISIKNGDEEMTASVRGFFSGMGDMDSTLKLTNIVDSKARRTAQEVAMEWAGRLGVSVVIVRPSTIKYHRGVCAICGEKLRVTDMAVKDMTPDQRDYFQVIRYKDLSRPLGDNLRHVHAACLDSRGGEHNKSRWPSGLIYVGEPEPDFSARRQKRAVVALKAEGISNLDAHKATMWISGKEPECISDLLDKPKPIYAGDKVVTSNGEVGIALEESCGRYVKGTLKVSFDGVVKNVPRHLVRKQ